MYEKGFTFVDNFFDEKSINNIKSIWLQIVFFYAADNPLKIIVLVLDILTTNFILLTILKDVKILKIFIFIF